MSKGGKLFSVKKVAVVILNYKVKEEVLECIESVEKSDYPDFQIIVVDNNSGDGLEEELEKFKVQSSKFKFVQTGDNLGFTGGNNVGIKKALDLGCEYIFVLNPDTKISQKCISELVSSLESDENIGVVGPKIMFDDHKTIWYAGGILDLMNVLGTHRGVDEKDLGQYDVVEETDFVSGAAMMVRSNMFQKVGLFDNDYFMYFEDVDFCYRVRLNGYRVMYTPLAVVYHKNAQSSGLGSPLQDYFITRNRMLFASKFLLLRTKFAIFREGLKNLGNPTRRLALWDFWVGKLGKGSFIK